MAEEVHGGGLRIRTPPLLPRPIPARPYIKYAIYGLVPGNYYLLSHKIYGFGNSLYSAGVRVTGDFYRSPEKYGPTVLDSVRDGYLGWGRGCLEGRLAIPGCSKNGVANTKKKERKHFRRENVWNRTYQKLSALWRRPPSHWAEWVDEWGGSIAEKQETLVRGMTDVNRKTSASQIPCASPSVSPENK
ncbi:hypothetical protein CEXT_793321 [Caerostris extrusa]|uniref:Uncharacterized protein n=1 Tax=Caerostris extrusa TaxID=172846 RepID=A0AAV4SWW4_CAEEX|nr:hypothetical protein CEXT_793321 [Caerostris extrusa]